MSPPEDRTSGAGTHTHPSAPDPRLRGRTYAIPYERVWIAATALAGGGIRRWRVVRSDDRDGVLEAERTPLLRKDPDRVEVRIRLDENAQTRLDLSCHRDGAGAERGHARLVDRFCRALDRALDARPSDILDATRTALRLDGSDA